MTVLEFLQDNSSMVNLSELARRMWPTNAGARAYLQKKLTGVRPWTTADTESAKDILQELAVDIDGLE